MAPPDKAPETTSPHSSSFAAKLQTFKHDAADVSTAAEPTLKRSADFTTNASSAKRFTRSSSRTAASKQSQGGEEAVADNAVLSSKLESDASGPAARSPATGSPGARSSSTKTPTAAARGPVAPGNPRGVISKLTDALDENLLVMFVGVNPGIATAETGHAYAHKSNNFWKLLHASALTPRRCQPSETHALVHWLRYGNTNLVSRPTKDASTLSKAECDAGVSDIERKAASYRPQVVCIVGKGIWESIERVWKRRGYQVAPFKYGWRPDGERLGKGMGMTMGTGMGGIAAMFTTAPAKSSKVNDHSSQGGEPWKGARVFVATTTSGLAASMGWEQKLAIWKELGDWVAERRKEEGWQPAPEPEAEHAQAAGAKPENKAETEET